MTTMTQATISAGNLPSKTSMNPSIAAFNGNLYMIFQNDDNISLTSSPGGNGNWSEAAPINYTYNGSNYPFQAWLSNALIAYNGLLYVAYVTYKTPPPTTPLSAASWDGSAQYWTDIGIIQEAEGPGSPSISGSPALATDGANLYIAFVGSDSYIYWMASSDGAGATWTDASRVQDENGNAIEASSSPSLIHYDGTLYLVYIGNDQMIYSAVRVPGTTYWTFTDAIINSAASSYGLALAVWNRNLYMTYPSSPNDDVNWAIFDGTEWTDFGGIADQNGNPVQLSESMSLAATGSALYMLNQFSGNISQLTLGWFTYS